MSEGDGGFAAAIRRIDEQVARAGRAIWVGMEPTFTDRLSEQPTWLGAAVGGDKEPRAQALVVALAARYPGCVLLRTVGRQYAGEQRPRWSYGVYARRDGTAVWSGPPDCLQQSNEIQTNTGSPGSSPAEFKDGASELQRALAVALARAGTTAAAVTVDGAAAPLRLVWRVDGKVIDDATLSDPELHRPCLGDCALPEEGARDLLSERDLRLIAVGADRGTGAVRVELPAVASVDEFLDLLTALREATRAVGLASLVLTGFPPPVDARIAWTTVTPDPGVIEVNMAPCRQAGELLESLQSLYSCATALDLSPRRWRYTGDETDSGGGGQLTFGGPSPSTSPFVLTPLLLARLVVYLNHHPGLSYAFAGEGVGGSSQAPRCDEGARETVDELALALALIDANGLCAASQDPTEIWAALAPFLTDRAGNSHRAEINVEKLWNPFLPGRGCSGLVELRALRMPASPEQATAIAVLFQTILSRLTHASASLKLCDWGNELHDRWSLPFHQRRDLAAVLADLRTHGFELPEAIQCQLLRDEHRVIGCAEFDGVDLVVRRASEFWPLTHEASPTNAGTSRLLDASTARTEVVLRSATTASLDGWTAIVCGRPTPLHREADERGSALVLGIRHRAFMPQPGLHPTLAPTDPLVIELNQADRQGWRVTLYGWRPDGGPYDGLPATAEEAARRRAERFVVARIPEPPAGARRVGSSPVSYVLDTRRPIGE